MIDLPRSSYYYRSTARALNLGDAELVAIIEDIQDELPCYGYRRVTHELQRRGHLVNHKRVARVMRANGLGIKPRKRYVRTTDSNHDSPIYPNLYRNVIPSRPDMVWVADFTYIRIPTSALPKANPKTKVLLLGAGGHIARHMNDALADDGEIEMMLFLRNAGRIVSPPANARLGPTAEMISAMRLLFGRSQNRCDI